MNDDNGVNMAFCPTCRALPHEPCTTGWITDEERRKMGLYRRAPHIDRQQIGGPRGGKRRR